MQCIGTLLRLFNITCQPVSGIFDHGKPDRQFFYFPEGLTGLVDGFPGCAERISRLPGIGNIFHMRNFSSHDTACLDRDGIFDRNRIGEKLDCADSVLDIGTLKALISIHESRINVLLDRPGLFDQIHQFPDEDISFFIHQVVSLTGQGQ